MDNPALSDSELDLVHRDLTLTHRLLGNDGAIVAALRRDPLPVRTLLDIGCGHGALLRHIRRKVGVQVTGVDLRARKDSDIPILEADAVRDPLPNADVAIAVCLIHHLSESDLIELIRNVGRSCRRFIVLDLVRHWLPLVLYRLFITPFVHSVVAFDGRQSIRRSWTATELRSIVERALAGSGASFRHTVAPAYARQMIDISWVSG